MAAFGFLSCKPGLLEESLSCLLYGYRLLTISLYVNEGQHCVRDSAYFSNTSVSCMLFSLCLIMLSIYVFPCHILSLLQTNIYWTAQVVSVMILLEFDFVSNLSYEFFKRPFRWGSQKLERMTLKNRIYFCSLREYLLKRSVQSHVR